jgi:hypothetical protein
MIVIPKIKTGGIKLAEVKGIKGLVGKRMTQKTKFMGEDILISKLSVIEVQEIQKLAREQEAEGKGNVLKAAQRAVDIRKLRDEGKTEEADLMEIETESVGSDEDGFGILRLVLRSAVEGASELTDEEFALFPMDELSTLSTTIMNFSGVGGKGK